MAGLSKTCARYAPSIVDDLGHAHCFPPPKCSILEAPGQNGALELSPFLRRPNLQENRFEGVSTNKAVLTNSGISFQHQKYSNEVQLEGDSVKGFMVVQKKHNTMPLEPRLYLTEFLNKLCRVPGLCEAHPKRQLS